MSINVSELMSMDVIDFIGTYIVNVRTLIIGEKPENITQSADKVYDLPEIKIEFKEVSLDFDEVLSLPDVGFISFAA